MPSLTTAGCLVPRLNGTFKATVRLTLPSISPSGQCWTGKFFWRFTARVERNPTRSGGRRMAAKVNGCLNSELGRANVSSIALAKKEAQRPSTHRPSDPNYRVRGRYRPRKDECDLARSRNVRQRNHCMFAMPHATARVWSDLPGSFAGISCH
jgi:hypothetical protein